MAKYAGLVGFVFYDETDPGVYDARIKTQYYTGDMIRNRKNTQAGSGVNDDITISNEISILADPFAYANFQYIKFATYIGVKWKVKSVEVQYPRLILELGDAYNDG